MKRLLIALMMSLLAVSANANSSEDSSRNNESLVAQTVVSAEPGTVTLLSVGLLRLVLSRRHLKSVK